MNKRVLLLLCMLVADIATAANSDADTHVVSSTWGLNGYAAAVSIDSQTALQQGVDDSAWLIGISADYIQNQWVTSIGIDLVVYDDNFEFSQEVEGTGIINNGDRSTKSSTANGGVIYVASGYQWLYGEQQNLALRLQGGFGVMTFSERSIDSCTNCYSEDIDIDAGLFAKASVLRSGESISFGLYYQQYLGGDGLNSVLGLSISSAF